MPRRRPPRRPDGDRHGRSMLVPAHAPQWRPQSSSESSSSGDLWPCRLRGGGAAARTARHVTSRTFMAHPAAAASPTARHSTHAQPMGVSDATRVSARSAAAGCNKVSPTYTGPVTCVPRGIKSGRYYTVRNFRTRKDRNSLSVAENFSCGDRVACSPSGTALGKGPEVLPAFQSHRRNLGEGGRRLRSAKRGDTTPGDCVVARGARPMGRGRCQRPTMEERCEWP